MGLGSQFERTLRRILQTIALHRLVMAPHRLLVAFLALQVASAFRINKVKKDGVQALYQGSSEVAVSQSTKFSGADLTQMLNLGVGLITSLVTAFSEDPID